MKNLTFSCLALVLLFLLGCTSKDQTVPNVQNKVFDIAMQGVNPAWFERAMGGIDFGIHRFDKYGELAADSATLFDNSFEQMDQHNIRYGLLTNGVFKEAFIDERPDMFLLSYEPDLSLADHTEAALEFEENILKGMLRWVNWD